MAQYFMNPREREFQIKKLTAAKKKWDVKAIAAIQDANRFREQGRKADADRKTKAAAFYLSRSENLNNAIQGLKRP